MLRAFIIIVITAGASYAFTDLDSSSTFLSVVLPVLLLVSVILFALWTALFMCKIGIDRDECMQKAQNDAPIAPDDFGGFGGDSGGA